MARGRSARAARPHASRRVRLRARVLRRRLARETRGRVTDPLFDLSERVGVVTGGMGQLGRVYAAGLAERGMRVAILDVASGDAPEGVRVFEVDVTDRAAV